MAYQVDKFNGTFLTSVEDGTIDTTTDIRFVGKNYAGYGEVQNENFLHMLENFANTTAPPKVVTGQIWFDSANNKLKYYDGTRFKIANGAETGATAPSGLGIGEFWWDTSSNQLYVWSGIEFALVGPESNPELGTSAAVAQVVKDTGLTNRSILTLSSGGKVIGIISKDAFTINNTINPIEGFTDVKKGFNLVDTNSSGVSQNDHIYWGTSSNALRLGGVAASDFVQRGNTVFDQEIVFRDPGFTLGDDNDLKVSIDTADGLLFENQLGEDITFRIVVTQTSDERDILKITESSIEPGVDNVYTVGTASRRWNNIHAVTFTGNLVGNVTGNTTGIHAGNVTGNGGTILVNSTTNHIGDATVTSPNLFGILQGSVVGNVQGTATNASRLTDFNPSITVPVDANKQSVVIRDSDGNINGVQFVGTADKADRLKIDDSATDTDPNYRSAKTTKTANTIAARDSSGNLLANIFDGTATAARYADLAEKYLTDLEYEVGTVVKVGGEAEVTACTAGSHVIGVVSENPAFMMNSELEGGTYIALKGRVPVKVGGGVQKGDTLVAGQNGYALSGSNGHVFGVALESNESESVKLIEAVIL